MAEFLSTLSLRRATASNFEDAQPTKHFYPRSPCGERPHPVGVTGGKIKISIHALLAESDRVILRVIRLPYAFLSTLSLRRATQSASYNAALADISIHALLAESDLVILRAVGDYVKFLSTLSLRRATNRGVNLLGFQAIISIHALLAESDRQESYLRPSQLISIHALLAESDILGLF